MTLSRDLSSSSFYSPTRASDNPCPLHRDYAPPSVFCRFSTTFTVARISSRHSTCAASGILGVGIIGKTPFNTQ